MRCRAFLVHLTAAQKWEIAASVYWLVGLMFLFNFFGGVGYPIFWGCLSGPPRHPLRLSTGCRASTTDNGPGCSQFIRPRIRGVMSGRGERYGCQRSVDGSNWERPFAACIVTFLADKILTLPAPRSRTVAIFSHRFCFLVL